MAAELSARQARRIAIAAQGLAEAAPKSQPGRRHLRRLFDQLGVVQMDSVNVLARTHYLPPFARLGGYPREVLEAEAWGKTPSLFEYWGHEASLMPLAMQPLLRWRMARARAGEGVWGGVARFGRERRAYVEEVLAEIGRRGPVTGGDFAGESRGAPGWWEWSDGKRALEWLFWAGLITTRTRRGFERVYDLTERVLPRAVLDAPTPEEPEAIRALLLVAARALGVAAETDLRDYFRLPVAQTRTALAELAEAGALTPVKVEGWARPGFLHPQARIPRRITAQALLSPFDNLIWTRERTERLFGVRVRLEIYTPADKREHGYYVLPLLQGERITGRADLKADRAAGALLVQAAHHEPHEAPGPVAEGLARELAAMAAWLGLPRVEVMGRGDLAEPLRQALAAPEASPPMRSGGGGLA